MSLRPTHPRALGRPRRRVPVGHGLRNHARQDGNIRRALESGTELWVDYIVVTP